MSQYYTVFNLDKEETLDPQRFGTSMKLGGIANADKPWLLMGLTYLLALGGSSLHGEDPLFGRWAGDRVAIVGDYYHGMLGGLEWGMDLWAR